MKKVLGHLLGCVFLLNQGLFGLTKEEERALKAIRASVQKSYPQAQQSSPTRLIKSADANRIESNLTAFGGANRFFIAANSTDSGNKTLAMAKLSLSASNTPKVIIVPLAPASGVTLNGNYVNKSPLNGVQVTTLGLVGEDKKVLTSVMLPEPNGVDTSTQYPSLYFLLNDDGTQLLGSTLDFANFSGFLLDTQTKPHKVINAPVALAATGSEAEDFIIAAVPQAGTTWNGQSSIDVPTPPYSKPAVDGRGLALVAIKNDDSTKNLGIVKAEHFSGSFPLSGIPASDVMQAYDRVFLQDKGPITFYAAKDSNITSRACLGNAVDMYWDNHLERLYIALSNVTRGDLNGNPNPSTAVSAGVTQVLIGRFADVLNPPGGEGEGDGEGSTLFRTMRDTGEDGGETSPDTKEPTGFVGEVSFAVSPVMRNINAYLLPSALTKDNGQSLDTTTNTADRFVLGFYRDSTQTKAQDKLFATANKIRVMHTSTGKSYLIINGGVAASADGSTPPPSLNAQVYAFPLIDKGPKHDDTGFVARNDDTSKIIDIQPIVDQAMSNTMGDQAQASLALYNLYYQQGNTDTYNVANTDVSDITDQASFRRFIKNAMPQNTNPVQRVGGTEDPTKINQLLSYDGSAKIADMQIVGDTVYVGLTSERDASHNGESGIFSSTALFSSNGDIRAWTPWQRVMGNTDAAYTIGFDKNSGNFWYFSTPDGTPAGDSGPSSVNVTQWGIGDPNLHGGNAPTDTTILLSTLLSSIFGASGGVNGLFDFGPSTPGFKVWTPGDVDNEENRHQQFGMMVATGNGKIALIETGSSFRTSTGIFQPTKAFTKFVGGKDPTADLNANVYVFSYDSPNYAGDALQGLGALGAAEVARIPAISDNDDDYQGWLFVGGIGGVAVLVQDYEGSGWPTMSGGGINRLLPGNQFSGLGSSSEDFPGGNAWFFVRLMQRIPKNGDIPERSINPFQGVRKLVSDGDKFLYVLTGQALFRVEMTYENFTSNVNFNDLEVRLDADKIVTIATMTDSLVFGASPVRTLGNGVDQFFDMMVVKRSLVPGQEKSSLVIATTRGLFLCDQVTDTVQDPKTLAWQPLTTALSNGILGATFSIDFVSSRRGKEYNVELDQLGNELLYADGNMSVLAFDPSWNYLARYRFDVAGGMITPFKEVYTTDYFYKIGTLVDPGNTIGNQLQDSFPLQFRTVNFPANVSGTASKIPIVPDPDFFNIDVESQEFKPIDLGYAISLPLSGGSFVRNESSGALYAAGEFGVRVNE